MSRVGWWLWLGGLVACVDDPPVPPAGCTDVVVDTGPDAGCGADGRVTLGERDAEGVFSAHVDGHAWALEKGPQGLQHVVVSMRVPVAPSTLPIDRVVVTWGAWRADDGETVAAPTTAGLALLPDGDGGVVPDVRVVVPEPDRFLDDVVGVDVVITAVGGDPSFHGWVSEALVWGPGQPDTD